MCVYTHTRMCIYRYMYIYVYQTVNSGAITIDGGSTIKLAISVRISIQ